MGEKVSAVETTILKSIPMLKQIYNLPKKAKNILVTSSSTIIPLNIFASFDQRIGDGVIFPRYIVEYGQRFTFEDISHKENSLRAYYSLHSSNVVRSSIRFRGEPADQLLRALLSAENNKDVILGSIQRIILDNISSVRYVDQTIAFFRIDKYMSYFECDDFDTAARTGLHDYLNRASGDDLLSTVKQIEPVAYDVPQRLQDSGMAQTTIAYWARANEIDPQIRPSHVLLDTMLLQSSTHADDVMALLNNLDNKIPDKSYEHVILLPHIQKGGADKAAGQLIDYLASKSQTLVLLTESASFSTEIERYKEKQGVDVIEVKNDLAQYPVDIQVDSLRLLLGSLRPKTIDIINSQVAYWLFQSRYKNMATSIKWYLHAYAHVYEEGYKIPPFHNGLCDAYPVVERYFTDSQLFAGELREYYGIEKSKIAPVYIPLEQTVNKKTDYRRKNRIVWIGRISREKLFHEVLDIAEMLLKDGIAIDVWGPIDESYVSMDEIERHENVRYQGVFSSINELDFDDYDMLLFTTVNEGLPNVIVEAISGGLFVVAPSVGGIPESVEFGKNALRVVDEKSGQSYYDSLMEAYKIGSYKAQVTLYDLADKVINQHSIQTYSKIMDKLRNNK